jgi:hypothetical protein
MVSVAMVRETERNGSLEESFPIQLYVPAEESQTLALYGSQLLMMNSVAPPTVRTPQLGSSLQSQCLWETG